MTGGHCILGLSDWGGSLEPTTLVLITSSEKREGLHESLQADSLTKYSWLTRGGIQAFLCSSLIRAELSRRSALILPCCQLLVGSRFTVSSAGQFILLFC